MSGSVVLAEAIIQEKKKPLRVWIRPRLTTGVCADTSESKRSFYPGPHQLVTPGGRRRHSIAAARGSGSAFSL